MVIKIKGEEVVKMDKLRMNLQLFADEPVAEPVAEPVVEPVVETVPVTEPVVEKVVEPVTEPVKPDKPESEEEIAGLKAQIEALNAKLTEATKAPEVVAESPELVQAKALLQAEQAQKTSLEAVLNTVIDSKLEGVPDNIKELIPAKLTVAEKLDWITKAEKSGILTKSGNPNIEIGKPMNPKAPTSNTDMAELSPSAKMAIAYGNSTTGRGKK